MAQLSFGELCIRLSHKQQNVCHGSMVNTLHIEPKLAPKTVNDFVGGCIKFVYISGLGN